MLGRVLFSWFVAVAISAVAVFILIALGVLARNETGPGAETWIALALAIGFFAGGFTAGMRDDTGPVLYGLAIAGMSLAAWLLVNLVFSATADLSDWTALSVGATAALLFLQAVAAVVGARMGARWRRGTRVPA